MFSSKFMNQFNWRNHINSSGFISTCSCVTGWLLGGFLVQTHSVYCHFFRKCFEIKLLIIIVVVVPNFKKWKKSKVAWWWLGGGEISGAAVLEKKRWKLPVGTVRNRPVSCLPRRAESVPLSSVLWPGEKMLPRFPGRTAWNFTKPVAKIQGGVCKLYWSTEQFPETMARFQPASERQPRVPRWQMTAKLRSTFLSNCKSVI